jgi:two-component system, NarL family, sensor histidine kinase UhpB
MAGRVQPHSQPRVQRLSLFWRVFATNAGVLLVAGGILSLSPASVPAPTSVSEIAVLLLGLTVMLMVNALLLRRAFAPLTRLTALTRRVDPLSPGERIPVYSRDAEVVELTRAFNQMLERLEAERRESARSALAGQESERQRLARELHDEISQGLTAVLLQLGRVAKRSPPGLLAEFEDAEDTVRSALEDVQRIVRELRPEALDELGLASALAILADRISEQTGLPIIRKVDPDPPALSPDEELVVYRIVQESLTNVVKHAAASKAVLKLERTPSGVSLSVRDDGCGLDGGWSTGKGIRGMRERALQIGAQLSLESPPDGGVEVRLILTAQGEQ